MSLFVMELVMLCASRPDIVGEVRVFPSFVFVRKSEQAPTFADFRLDELYTKRGMEIVGAEQATLGKLSKLFGSRVHSSVKRTASRLSRRLRSS